VSNEIREDDRKGDGQRNGEESVVAYLKQWRSSEAQKPRLVAPGADQVCWPGM